MLWVMERERELWNGHDELTHNKNVNQMHCNSMLLILFIINQIGMVMNGDVGQWHRQSNMFHIPL